MQIHGKANTWNSIPTRKLNPNEASTWNSITTGKLKPNKASTWKSKYME